MVCLINRLSYAFVHTEVMIPFRELLQKKALYLDSNLDATFAASKDETVRLEQNGIKSFETISYPTFLATDWSKTGIRFTLTHKHCKYQHPF